MKLSKRQLSVKLNVSDSTIYLWEKNRVEPSLAKIPKIIDFLGRDPFETPAGNLAESVKIYRRLNGLSQKKFSELLGVNQSTLASWESGKHWPTKRLHNHLSSFFSSFAENASMK